MVAIPAIFIVLAGLILAMQIPLSGWLDPWRRFHVAGNRSDQLCNECKCRRFSDFEAGTGYSAQKILQES